MIPFSHDQSVNIFLLWVTGWHFILWYQVYLLAQMCTFSVSSMLLLFSEPLFVFSCIYILLSLYWIPRSIHSSLPPLLSSEKPCKVGQAKKVLLAQVSFMAQWGLESRALRSQSTTTPKADLHKYSLKTTCWLEYSGNCSSQKQLFYSLQWYNGRFIISDWWAF